MICPTCRGRGFVPAGETDDDLAEMKPCPECLGGVASCCDAAGSRPIGAFTCPRCGATSFNPNDIRERYCGRCHAFVDGPSPSPAVQKAMDNYWRGYNARLIAEAAYHDDTFPERMCDGCGQLYRGPAVYCSLECAVDDA